MYEAVRRLAAEQRRSMAACVREALATYLVQAGKRVDDLSDIAGRFRPVPADDLKAHDRDWASAAVKSRDSR